MHLGLRTLATGKRKRRRFVDSNASHERLVWREYEYVDTKDMGAVFGVLARAPRVVPAGWSKVKDECTLWLHHLQRAIGPVQTLCVVLLGFRAPPQPLCSVGLKHLDEIVRSLSSRVRKAEASIRNEFIVE